MPRRMTLIAQKQTLGRRRALLTLFCVVIGCVGWLLLGRRLQASNTIFPLASSGSPDGALPDCKVDFTCQIMINDTDMVAPVTATVAYSATDAQGNTLPAAAISGPSSVSVCNQSPTNPKKWTSNSFQVSVDGAYAAVASCTLTITPSDGGIDTPSSSNTPFTAPCRS